MAKIRCVWDQTMIQNWKSNLKNYRQMQMNWILRSLYWLQLKKCFQRDDYNVLYIIVLLRLEVLHIETKLKNLKLIFLNSVSLVPNLLHAMIAVFSSCLLVCLLSFSAYLLLCIVCVFDNLVFDMSDCSNVWIFCLFGNVLSSTLWCLFFLSFHFSFVHCDNFTIKEWYMNIIWK